MTWEYDEDADFLYLSLGIDAGEGIIVRFDAERNEMSGLTVIGLRARILEGLKSKSLAE